MSRMSDQSKSRRQVVRQLVQLGLIGSAKELKKMRSPLVGLLTRTINTCSTHLLAFRDLRPSVFDEETTGQLLHTYTPRHTRGELEITALNLQPDGAIQICLLLLFFTLVLNSQGMKKLLYANTNTHPFNGPLSRTTRVSRYQKGKTNLDFTEARDSEWQ